MIVDDNNNLFIYSKYNKRVYIKEYFIFDYMESQFIKYGSIDHDY